MFLIRDEDTKFVRSFEPVPMAEGADRAPPACGC
jgi:hypothetical protein